MPVAASLGGRLHSRMSLHAKHVTAANKCPAMCWTAPRSKVYHDLHSGVYHVSFHAQAAAPVDDDDEEDSSEEESDEEVCALSSGAACEPGIGFGAS